jgi:hypothetical protein
MNERARGSGLLLAAIGWVLSCLPATAALGQSRGATAAVVIYAEGRRFSVVNARGLTVGIDPDEPIGLELVAGDTVVTEHETFLELQLVPSSNVVKIAENTNFTIVDRASPRGGTFTLVYGKVRARVQTLTDKEQFSIRGESAVAGVRGTDFGVTVEVARSAAASGEDSGSAAGASESTTARASESGAVTQVFCFEGEVEVSRPAPASEGAAQTRAAGVVVRANEIVSVGRESEIAQADVQPLPAEVRSYWETNPFKAQPAAEPLEERGPAQRPAGAEAAEPVRAAAEPAPREEPKAAVTTASDEEVRQSLVKRMVVTRSQVRTASVVLFGVGAALGIVGAVDALLPSVSILGDNGIGPIGVGAVFVIGGVFSTIQVGKIGRVLEGLRTDGRAP